MASLQDKIAQNRTSVEDFHCLRPDQAERYLAKGLREEVINEEDANLIRIYLAELESTHNIGNLRGIKITATLISWRRFAKPYREIKIEDIYSGIAGLKRGTSKRGAPYKQNTIYDFVRILKPFCLWLIENEYSEIPEKKVRNLKVPPRDQMTKVASDLLTIDEVNAMVKGCCRSMDRALIMMLYEGGFRIGEVGLMKWSHVVFDGNGLKVNVNFKTGKPRYIRLIMAKQYLAQWKHDYPADPDIPNMLVFLNERNKPLTHHGVYNQLKRIATRAGVTKNITPHIFRHSRITHLMIDKMPESVIKLMMWGNITTNQFKTYVHLTGQNIDDAVMAHYGIQGDAKEAKKMKRMEPVQCPLCQNINPPLAGFCCGCGMQFTEEAIQEYEKVKIITNNNPTAMAAYWDAKSKGKSYQLHADEPGLT